jgi:hypothetical protein
MRAAALHVAQASRWIHHRAGYTGLVDPHGSSPLPPTRLLERLAEALQSASVRCCQWKGLWRTAGGGDTDLLVDRSHAAQFRRIAEGLGFKPVLPSGARQLPGVESFLGHEPALAHPLHLHVHYQLVVDDYWRTVYRLPIEEALLDSAARGEVFAVPSPPYQFLIYTVRMLLRLPPWPLLLWRPRWIAGIQGQLDYLEGRCDRDEIAAILVRHLPTVDLPLLDRCLRALRGEVQSVEVLATRRTLHHRLTSHMRHPSPGRLMTAAAEKLLPRPLRPMLLDGRMRPSAGGLVVALVGGDGTSTSTCARELQAWLTPNLPVLHARLRRPTGSLLTTMADAAVKAETLLDRLVGRGPKHETPIQMLRHLCTARARFQQYRKAQRFAVSGGVVICDGYPLPQNRLLIGPSIARVAPPEPSRWVTRLSAWERRYYDMILPPQTICVLRREPDSTVTRAPSEELADNVPSPAPADWSGTPAHLIDAGRPLPDVVGDLRDLVWSAL